MPRLRIIVLELEAPETYRYALWADVPAARQPFYANPGAVSVWGGASSADNAALASGAVVERSDVLSLPAGGTLAQAQAQLIATWSAFQAEITGTNHWGRYGTTWDGSAWVAAGVA